MTPNPPETKATGAGAASPTELTRPSSEAVEAPACARLDADPPDVPQKGSTATPTEASTAVSTEASTAASTEASTAASTGDSLARRTARASAGVFLSRFSGVFRSQIVNAVFGATTRLDAFNVAMRYPSALRDLFAEGALSAAFTKSLVRAQAEGKDQVRALVATVSGFFLIVTLGVAAVAALFSEEVLRFGTAEEFAARGGLPLAMASFKVLAFYLPVAMMSALAMALLGALGQTFRATIASAFFNLGSVLGALALAPLFAALGHDAVVGLAVGTLAGGFLQFLYQAAPLVRQGYFPFPNLNPRAHWKSSELREILALMGPRALGQGAMTLALLINTHFATAAGQGAITYITNAQIIILVPVGLFGVAAGFSSLPILSEAVRTRDGGTYARVLSESLMGSLWMAFFSLAQFALLAVPLCALLFEHGKITWHDSLQNGLAVCAYATGVLFNSGNKVLVQGFYALGDTRRLVLNAFVYLSVNAALSATLAPHLGVLGLGLSNSIAAAADFLLNYFVLKRLCREADMDVGFFTAEGKGERVRMWALCGLAFAVGALGVVMSGRVYPGLFENGIAFWEACALTVCGGGFVSAAFVPLMLRFGPAPLRTFVSRALRKVRLGGVVRIFSRGQ